MITTSSPRRSSSIGTRRRGRTARRTRHGSSRTSLTRVTLYAAYGTNLDPRRMGERCPHSPLRGTGWLQGWRLTFGGEDHGWDGALATVVQDPFEQVFVALYDVTDEDAAQLDELGVGRHRAVPQDQGARLHADRRGRRLDLRARRLRGRAPLGDATSACSPTPPRPPTPRPTTSRAPCAALPLDRTPSGRRRLECPGDDRDLPRSDAAAAEAAAVLAEQTGVERHDVALVLGSGWLPAVDALGEATAEISTTDLPGFAPPAVAGHAGKIRSVAPGTGTCWSSSAAPTSTRASACARSSTASGPRRRPAAAPSCSPTAAAASTSAGRPARRC